ncbi:MAG: BlaI/MecI/CopY family transcriptional regulator [Eubacteriales bacterium]|nr:BlaI/MecI/CopY family transcriptional regulator [Eubacteriales bacterium]
MTKTEMMILETLWESETPLCAGDILARNPEVKEITLRTALKNMLKKDLISVDGMIQRTKNYARTFRANVTSEEILYNNAKQITNLSPFKFTCSLLKKDTFSKEELETLKSIIEERIHQ